ncbi:MAG: glycosyltransferase family 4 protein [Pseudomonadales bacterium]|nr:glycosyltransferase family 4 protein [Pseudomonadales bacterium]
MASTQAPYVIHLICSSGFYGAEKVVSNLCKEMPGKNMAVLCLTNKNHCALAFEKTVVNAGVKFYISENHTMRSLAVLKELTVAHSSVVIHAHGYKEVFVACLFKRLRQCKIIVTQHGFTARNIKSNLYNLANLTLCRWAGVERVLCVSQEIYDRYQKFGIPSHRLTLLPNGVTLPKSLDKEDAKIQMEARYDLPPGVPLVLFAGRLSDEKDPILFTSIVREMMALQVNFFALVAGDGPLKNAVCEAVEQNGLSRCLKVLGFVGDINTLLAATDILLLTSTTEGVPMVILEAMTQKCVVVSADVGGISGIIVIDQEGVLVGSRDPSQYAKHCVELLNNELKLKKIAENAERKVREQFCLSKQIPIYRDIYGSKG